MHLFVDISSHGFGHLAISAPILNALRARCPELRLSLRSALPAEQLASRLKGDFELIPSASDFGFVMHDATRVDLAASAEAYRQAHSDWPSRVAREADFLKHLSPDLVFSNVSYLPLAGAARAGIPAWAGCSLHWGDLFAHFFGRELWARPILEEITKAYHSVEKFLRMTPGMPMPTLPQAVPVPPIAAIGQAHDLGLPGERVVLLAMGGIAHRLPVDNWPVTPGLRWLLPRAWQCQHPNALNWEDFDLSFTDMLCSVDAVVTKPGYGTFTEAACNGTPVLYQRRADWPEQESLIDWLQQHACAGEIGAATLLDGQGLATALAQLWQKPRPPRPQAKGATDAAEMLAIRLSDGQPPPMAAA